jgi:uncharacterized membrane protein YebE (DUF533 family)
MTYPEITDSRFHMWRAVFAMAHVDGKITTEEREFAQKYLTNAPFSEPQKEQLARDLDQPQNVGEMLMHVTEMEDQADFFQFSHMLAWKDGEYAPQEHNLIERFNSEQMQRFNKAQITQALHEARKATILRRAIEDKEFAKQANDVSGFANVIRFVAPWMEMKTFQAPDEEMFALWRAVFSLVHADGEIAAEERGYIEGMMEVFRFSEDQRKAIEHDLKKAPDTLSLFKTLKSESHRKQFFIMARTIIWCDGFFHEKERALIEKIRKALGKDIAGYESELRWIDRKPEMIPENALETHQEAMMKNVVRQMLDFYKDAVL